MGIYIYIYIYMHVVQSHATARVYIYYRTSLDDINRANLDITGESYTHVYIGTLVCIYDLVIFMHST